jgi:hypothetical protein
MTNDDEKDTVIETLKERDEDVVVPPPYPQPPPATSAGIPYRIRTPKVWQDVIRYQFLYSLAGLGLGLVCIIGGVILFLRGVTGSTSWTAKVLGLESNITDAAPGVVLFVVGLFLVFVTRFVIKTEK